MLPMNYTFIISTNLDHTIKKVFVKFLKTILKTKPSLNRARSKKPKVQIKLGKATAH